MPDNAEAERIRELEAALSHVLEFIPADSKCETCLAAKKLAYECNRKIAKALECHA